MKISPSILSADFTKLSREIKAVEQAGADYIHIDVMDGHFVPNITIGPFIVEAAKRSSDLPLDVHLMIERPELYIADFVKAGSDIITVHVESTAHLHGVLQSIKRAGVRAGVSVNPGTPVETIAPVINDIDLLLIMTVNPGFSGQSFIESSIEKIKTARAMLDDAGSEAELEVDGGIKASNIALVAEAGANVCVAGSAVYGSDNYKKTIEDMKKAASQIAQ